MDDLLYDLVSRMPYYIPAHQDTLFQKTKNGYQEPEEWNYIEARLLNAKVLKDYKKIDFFGKLCMWLTGGSQKTKKLINQKKEKFVKRTEGTLYITDCQVFFEGKSYHMCRSHHKITKVEEVGNSIRIVYGKKEEWFLVQNPKIVLRKLLQYVDRTCLLQGCANYKKLKEKNLDKEVELYEYIYVALLKLKNMVVVDKLDNGVKICEKVLQQVLIDHPLIYYVNPKKTEISLEEHVVRIVFSYVYNQQQCEALNSALLRRISKILRDGIVCCGQDKELLKKWLYAYLEQMAAYVEVEPKNSEDEVQYRIHTILGVFLDKKMACDGMEKAMNLLLKEINRDNQELYLYKIEE